MKHTTTNPFDALKELAVDCSKAARALREVHEEDTIDDLYGLMGFVAKDLDLYASEARRVFDEGADYQADIAADYAEERDQAVDATSNLAQDILDFEHGLLDYHELLQAAKENL